MNEALCLLDYNPVPRGNNRITVLRGKRLGITPGETKRLPLDKLKAKARHNFRQRIKLVHPDRVRQDSTHYTFRHLVDAYHYLMDLESKMVEEPIHYYPLPWHWQWTSSLPEGWQDVES